MGRIRAGQARGLKLLHFPAVAVQSGLWPALLTRMKIDLEAFITRHLDQIIPRITTQSPLNQVTGMWTNFGLRFSVSEGGFNEIEIGAGVVKCGLGILGLQVTENAKWFKHKEGLPAASDC